MMTRAALAEYWFGFWSALGLASVLFILFFCVLSFFGVKQIPFPGLE